MLVKHAQRGQALVETMMLLPVALVVLFAILYFARFGVLEERAQSAVRYGALMSYESASNYSASDIYNTVGSHPPPISVCSANVVPDTVTALNGTGPSGSAQPFWKPDHPATATCTVSTASFGGASWAAYHYLTITKHTVTASMDVPAYVTSVLGMTGNVTASLAYAHADPPSTIIYCVSNTAAAVAAGLNVSYTGGSC
jgi:Flp pilus assembly protein TadG